MNDVVWSLGAVSDLWLDTNHPLREETILALQISTGLSRRPIELALANCFEELSAPKINAYVDSFESSPRRTVNVLHVLPSNAFTAWIHGAVTTLLRGHRLYLKPSLREPVFARAWKRSLEAVDPQLAQKVEIVPWDDQRLDDYQAVVAYGSDETLLQIRSKLRPETIFAGYGHKLSVGVIFKEALSEGLSVDLLQRVCRDAEPFRLQGCLSPQILYMEDSNYSRWPELGLALDVAPKIRGISPGGAVLNELGKFFPYLSCVGFAGHRERAQFLERELESLRVSRICSLGEMQRPPLSWRNGGMFLPEILTC